jgi:choline kinase
MVKFGAQGGRLLQESLTHLVNEGHANDWAPFAFREVARTWPLHAIATDGHPWIEIDHAADLDRAQRIVAPAIAALNTTAGIG